MSFQWRDEFAKALMGDTGIQVGVGVPGGQQLLTLAVEALLRENPELRALNLDIANCFNSLDRVALIEDLLNSREICGYDFSSLVPYVHSFYCEGHGAWFWVEADQSIPNPASGGVGGTPRPREGWYEWVASELGTVQGAPLSCFFAALSLLACLRAAQARLRGDIATMQDADVAERSMVSSYLDDAGFVTRPALHPNAYAAYARAAAARARF